MLFKPGENQIDFNPENSLSTSDQRPQRKAMDRSLSGLYNRRITEAARHKWKRNIYSGICGLTLGAAGVNTYLLNHDLVPDTTPANLGWGIAFGLISGRAGVNHRYAQNSEQMATRYAAYEVEEAHYEERGAQIWAANRLLEQETTAEEVLGYPII